MRLDKINVFSGLISLSFFLSAQGLLITDADAAPRKKAKVANVYKKVSPKKTLDVMPSDSLTTIHGVPADVSFIVAEFEGRNFRILNQDMPHERRSPASTTKLMTLDIIFDELKAGRLSLTDRIVMTKEATHLERALLSRIYGVKSGQTFSVEEGIYSLLLLSSNDVALSFAVHIGGSEEGFVAMMNEKAKALGMTNSHFVNPHGLRDVNQYVTAHDMMKLALHQNLDQSEYSYYFSKLSFNFRGKKISSENALLASYRGADWSKTGYNFTGYQIVLSAVRDFMNEGQIVQRRIFGGFFGGVTPSQRFNCMGWLMDDGFKRIGADIQGSRFKFSEIGCTAKRNPKSPHSLAAGITPQ